MAHPIGRLLDDLARGFVSDVHTALSDHAVVEDPRAGRVSGIEPLEHWVSDAHRWFAARRAATRPVRLTERAGRAVMESVLDLDEAGKRIALPVAVVGEVAGEGELVAVRLYHGFWPLEGRHRVRPTLLPRRDDLVLPDVVGAYQRALAEGDLEGVLACFEREAVVREPSGEPFAHSGQDGLRRFYAALLSNGGGLPLEHCSVVDDGVACAVEYNVVRWGRTPLPPQPGVAVYERGRSGRLAAARIYDDVDPPLPR
jgi:hypothetical protein